MELNEKDLHCLARQLQGDLYEHDRFFCCRGYCKYSGACEQDIRKHKGFHYNILRKHLEAVTGVYLGWLANPEFVYRQMERDFYFEANGIDPFQENLEQDCPQYAMDWIHARGLKEKAARFRSMLRIKGANAKYAVKAMGVYWGSLAAANMNMLALRWKKRREVK